jgi:spectinomycin phosphotransferase/16S rRNA (guanine(1405)-N(7))-methyltransferase
VFTRPDDLGDSAIVSALLDGWGIEAEDINYAPIGFGSHHWRATANGRRWFVTVDDLDTRLRSAQDSRQAAQRRLTAALSTAAALWRCGGQFVVAPTAKTRGGVLEQLDDRYVLAVYPFVDGVTGSWGRYESESDRRSVVDRLVEIHGATDCVREVVETEDFRLPARDQLDIAIDGRSTPWSTGPYAEPTRALLNQHADALKGALRGYDDLVARSQPRPESMVVTHGEPHRGNVIFTADGASLVDWDTALLAPPERDLWALINEEPTIAAYYAGQSGRTLDLDLLDLYRLRWDLCEVSLYVSSFRAPHGDTADSNKAWDELTECLDPSRWVSRESE